MTGDGPLRHLDVFIPPAPRPREERLRLRMAVGMTLLSGLVTLLFVPLNLRAGHPTLALLYTVSAIVALACLGLYRLWGKAALVVHTHAVIASVMLVLTCVEFGKADVGTLIYFAVIPLALLFVGGPRAGLFWAVAGTCISMAVFFADARGWLPPAKARNTPLSDLLNVVSPLLLAFVFAWLFNKVKSRAVEELDDANRELADARAKAERANRAKSDFLATMTHELRTPMNGVIGMADMVLDSRLDEQQRTMVATLKRSGEALLELVDDILDFEKIEAGRIEIVVTDADVRALATSVVDMLAFRAREKGLALTLVVDDDVPASVRLDPARMRQVLLNIVSNAIKFTLSGAVAVRVRGKGARLTFQVTDTGIGIPHEHHPKLFEPFTQGDSSTARHFGGTGLGLSICKRLVTAMGGEITFESAVGSGSTFFVSVPLLRAEEPRPLAPPPITPVASGLRALIVEDNPVNAQVTKHLLQGRGLSCEIAPDGTAALEQLMRQRYDIVFMDCQLPTIDGFEATRLWRQHEGGARTPIVAMTAGTGASERQAAADAGMDDYLTKPVTAEELDRVIARYTARHPS